MSGYSTKQVAELIGMSPQQIRHYVRRRLLEPSRGKRREFRFSFQDVVFLRTVKGLLAASCTSRQTFKALSKIKTELAPVKSLSAVRISANGDVVMVHEDNAYWEAESGQAHFDFSVRELASEVAELVRANFGGGKEPDELDSDEWYNLGLDLEEVDPTHAPNAYKEAIRLDPENADAHVNLGRLHQLDGDLKMAKHHYEAALKVRPEHELANYNLGTIFDELEEPSTAAEYYKRAPYIPDAHYNLARIHELEGDEINARRHLRRYQVLVEQEGF